MMSTTTDTKHILVSGLVQGVGFRYNLRHRAIASGVTGWCRNLADGRVEAILNGTPDAVEVVLFWCQQGPAGARVDDLVVHDISPDESYTSFQIRETP